jgi:hypothetical protein
MREIYKVERILNVGIRLYECTSRSAHQTWYPLFNESKVLNR